MALHDRIREARKNKGITQTELGEKIGVAKTTIAGYEKNREPTAAQLGEIADVLDVDITFLLQDEIKERFELHATPKEMECLVKKYRTLDEYGKDMVLTVTDKEYARCMKQVRSVSSLDEPLRIIPLRLSVQPVAAGTGTYLGPEQFQTIYVRDSKFVHNAAYAVPVSGDSMEPLYHHNDILLISSEQADIGDIGIFTLNGMGYVKKLGKGFLLSLNSDYGPIPMDDTIRCNGKVIGVLAKEDVIEK